MAYVEDDVVDLGFERRAVSGEPRLRAAGLEAGNYQRPIRGAQASIASEVVPAVRAHLRRGAVGAALHAVQACYERRRTIELPQTGLVRVTRYLTIDLRLSIAVAIGAGTHVVGRSTPNLKRRISQLSVRAAQVRALEVHEDCARSAARTVCRDRVIAATELDHRWLR